MNRTYLESLTLSELLLKLNDTRIAVLFAQDSLHREELQDKAEQYWTVARSKVKTDSDRALLNSADTGDLTGKEIDELAEQE